MRARIVQVLSMENQVLSSGGAGVVLVLAAIAAASVGAGSSLTLGAEDLKEQVLRSSAGNGDPHSLQTRCEVQWAPRHIWQWWAKAFSSSCRILPCMDVLCTSATFKPPLKKCKWLKEPGYYCMTRCSLITFCSCGFFSDIFFQILLVDDVAVI